MTVNDCVRDAAAVLMAAGFSPVELVEPLYVRLPDAVEAAL